MLIVNNNKCIAQAVLAVHLVLFEINYGLYSDEKECNLP
jgi:hypothetical protein